MTPGQKIDLNENHLNGGRSLAYSKDQLARFAFEAAKRWSGQQPSPLKSEADQYEALSEGDRDFFGAIAEQIARWTLIGDAARFALIEEQRPLEKMFEELVRAVEFARRRLMTAAVDDQMRIIQGGGREWERRIWSSFAEFDAVMHGQLTASESTPVYHSEGSEDWKPRYTGTRLKYEMAEARRRGQMDVIETLEQKALDQRQYFDAKQLSLPGIEDLTDNDGQLKLPEDITPLLEERTAHGRFCEADWWLHTIQALKVDLFTKGHRPFEDETKKDGGE
jgi:hypothetical protein